jgi:hypothetical protein
VDYHVIEGAEHQSKFVVSLFEEMSLVDMARYFAGNHRLREFDPLLQPGYDGARKQIGANQGQAEYRDIQNDIDGFHIIHGRVHAWFHALHHDVPIDSVNVGKK